MNQNEIIKAIKTILEDIALPNVPSQELEYQMIIDTQNHHYQVVVSGWRGMDYTHGILVQIDLRNDYVWIAVDNTDYDVAGQLHLMGIPKDRIVLGFHPPATRQYTDFAIGE
jgi:hypothetical protein